MMGKVAMSGTLSTSPLRPILHPSPLGAAGLSNAPWHQEGRPHRAPFLIETILKGLAPQQFNVVLISFASEIKVAAVVVGMDLPL